MHLLVLGGTGFLGRHVTQAALDAGHEVTMLNRGRTDPGLFPHVELILADRDGDLSVLEGRSWDGVVDTCGYVPRVVEASAQRLQRSHRYLFVSTVSVYADMFAGNDEGSAVFDAHDHGTEEVTGSTYGPMKAGCERAVNAVFGPRATIVRPGLIVGPHDPTDRFTYWPVRIAQGGMVVAPLPQEADVQFVDVRDLATFMITLLSRDAGGVFNVTGPAERTTLGAVIEACREVAGPAQIRWVDPRLLVEAGVRPSGRGRMNTYTFGLPLWVPDVRSAGIYRVDNAKALKAGLTLRPMTRTIRDTLDWAMRRDDHVLRAGLTPQQEKAIITTI